MSDQAEADEAKQVGLSKEDVERLISQEMTDGLEYVYGADNIAADRDRNYDYYRGLMNDLPAPKGRSRVVEYTIANFIGLMQPAILRIFTAGRNLAEYVSPKPEMQKPVKLITRFINDVVFRKDNRGEAILVDWSFDGLVQKVGFAMWWWEEKYEAKDETLPGLTPEMLTMMMPMIEQSGAEVVEGEQAEDGTYTIKVRTKVNKSQCCIDVIPPEEFICSKWARTLDGAAFKAHSAGAKVGDLISAGFDAEALEDLPTYVQPYPDRTQNKYNQGLGAPPGDKGNGASIDPMQRMVRITRGILNCDYDGSGLRDWYVVAGGEPGSPKLLEIDAYNSQIGFADFCSEPMPHTIFGRCPADRLAGLQKIQTVLIRQANDNLFLSNTPQREVVMDWIVKPDQLTNMSPGAPVLVKQPGAIREISVPFVADKAMAMMDYYDGRAEMITGAGRNTIGLDTDALTNQSAEAARNLQTNQQMRPEMIARIWAQGGMRKLFRGVFKCIKAYQDFARVEQIDGKPETIDPSLWEGMDDLDVNINTGLGTGNRERDYAMLGGIVAEQKEIIATLGPQNPIVDLQKAVRTLQLKAEAAGIAYPENFFADATNPDGTPWAPPPPPPPQPTPDTLVLAQTEQGKIQSDERKKMMEVQANREEAAAKIASDERIAYRQQDIDLAVKLEELGIKKADTLIKAAEVDAKRIAADMKAASDVDAA